jgi:hypothetical protein
MLTFESAWSDEEALAEVKRDFPDTPLEDCVQICDDCYQSFTAWRTAEEPS